MTNPTSQPATPLFDGIAIVRVVLGSLLIAHGLPLLDGDSLLALRDHVAMNKDLSPDQVWTHAPALIELTAGAFLVVGLFTRFAAVMLFLTFMFTTFVVGEGRAFTENQQPFVLGLISLLFFFTGAGRISIDFLLRVYRRTEVADNHAATKAFGRYVTKG